MRRKLPSLPSLQAFDAVARNRSFTRAAIELGVTQAAVTQHVKNLEDMLGAQLFVRAAGAVTPTHAATAYLATIQPALYEISHATHRLIDQGSGGVVTVACLGAFAARRLLPLLREFRVAHRDIPFHVRTMVQFDAGAPADYDIAIWHGLGRWPGVVAERVLDEEIFPVCNPSLLRARHALATLDDLQHHTVIRANSEILRDDWPFWLDAAGIPHMSFANEMACNYLLISLQAAVDGLGIAIGRTGIVEADIAAGRLVEPFRLRLPSPTAYYVVTPAGKPQSREATTLRCWLVDHLRQAPGALT